MNHSLQLQTCAVQLCTIDCAPFTHALHAQSLSHHVAIAMAGFAGWIESLLFSHMMWNSRAWS